MSFFKAATTMFVMGGLFALAASSQAWAEFAFIPPSQNLTLTFSGLIPSGGLSEQIDLQAVNELNEKAPSLSFQQKKDSFKLFILSTQFTSQFVHNGSRSEPLIRGYFDRDLLKA